LKQPTSSKATGRSIFASGLVWSQLT